MKKAIISTIITLGIFAGCAQPNNNIQSKSTIQELRPVVGDAGVPDASISFQSDYSKYIWADNPLVYVPNFGLTFDTDHDSYVDFNSTQLDDLDNFTIEFWFDPATTGTFDNYGSTVFQNIDENGTTSGLLFQWQDQAQEFRFNTVPNSTTLITFDKDLLKEGSNYVVFESRTNGVKLFLNGVLVADETYSNYTSSEGRPFRIGANTIAGQNYVGKLDNFAIYNTELSTDEILQHYAVGADLLKR
jgi:Concanavalin A-like lectin/glucanases superfamily